MQPDAPLLHDDLFTVGVEPKPNKPSNVAKRIEIVQGDIEAGFAKADIIVEREFNTAPVHQGYIEPHATVASVSEDGSAEARSSSSPRSPAGETARHPPASQSVSMGSEGSFAHSPMEPS